MIELQVLNKILQEKDSNFIILNNLDVEYFSDYPNEFNYIISHLNKYKTVPDLETFLNTFSNFEVIKVKESDAYLLEELQKNKNSHALAKVFNAVRNLLLDDKIDEAVNTYQAAYEKLSVTTTLHSVDLFKDTSRYNAFIERTRDFNKYYITTGFKELDEIIGGWDKEEELATIVARTNVGKSWILLKCAAAAAEAGLTVGLYSGEMSERKIGYRLDTLIGHISNGSLIHGNGNIENEYKRYIDNLPTMFKGTIKVITPKMINGPAGVNALKAFVEKEKIDILFIDQHSLLEDDRKAKNPVERASNISKDLKNMQVMSHIPIVAASQQNRTTLETGVNTVQIAQSDRIGQDSSSVLFLERDKDILKLILVKSRDSENGKTLSYHIDFNTGIFTYIPEDGNASESNLQDKYKQNVATGKDVF